MQYGEATTAVQYDSRVDPLDVFSRATTVGGRGELLEAAIAPVIREAIVSGALAGGTRLSEAQVARRLRVSRTPVRQALIQLEHERLVVIVPHIGASVRTITLEDVEEIYEVRIALEVLASKLAIGRMSPIGKAELGEAMNRLRSTVGEPDTYGEALDAFHLLIMRLAGNRTLLQIYEGLVGPIRRFRRINLGKPERIERSVRANLRIGRALLAADRTAAELMEKHLQHACDDIIGILRRS